MVVLVGLYSGFCVVICGVLCGVLCGLCGGSDNSESVDISRGLGDGVMLLLYNNYDVDDGLVMGGFGWGYGVVSALLRALYPKIIKIPNTRSVTIYLHINYIDITT